MKIHLLFPVLPPALDGIGDYTARLAETLSAHHEVKVLSGPGTFGEIADVQQEVLGSLQQARLRTDLLEVVRRDDPDWIVVQYNPFSYGRWGLNPFLPWAVRHVRRRHPRTRVALMVHEPFVPIEDWKQAVMTTWQRGQLWRLGHTADVLFFSIEPWTHRFRRWFPEKPVHHLPVGSNIPREAFTRQEARRRIGLAEDVFVLGVFGSAHPSRLLHFVRAAARAVAHDVEALRLLYIGAAGARVRDVMDGVPLIDMGPLPGAEVSRHFAAMDLYAAPFRKGVSSRRGSFMAGLQHGMATLSTYGAHTDGTFCAHNGSAFLLVPDDAEEQYARCARELARDEERRREIARKGRELFDATFAWRHIAERLLMALEASPGAGSSSGTC